MKATNTVVHSWYVIDLLKTLKTKGIGTNSVETLTRKLCSKEGTRKTILQQVMKMKINDVYKKNRTSMYECQKAWKTYDNKLIREGVLEAFLLAWGSEKLRYRQTLRSLRKKKVQWLKEKYKRKCILPEECYGFKFKDQQLREEFRVESIKYGGIALNTDEEAAVKLHPKYTVYEKLNPGKFAAEVEKALTEVRWDRGFRQRREPHENGNDQNTTKEEREGCYDFTTKTYDMRKLASTDLPFNSRVYLPNPLDEPTEVAMQMMKRKINTVANRYTERSKRQKVNLTTEQRRGIRSLKRKRDEGEIVVYQKDKSMRLAVDTTGNYKESMKPHIENDEEISKGDNADIEKLMNAHSVSWLRFLQAGKGSDEYRIKMSMQSHNNDASVICALRKDHKELSQGARSEEGPPVRPVCDISDGVNHKLSYLISNLLQEMCDGETVCNSTEDMLASVEMTNQEGVEEDTIIRSMDVISLYPSLDIQHAIKVICEEFENSDIKIEGIDYEELSLYLALTEEHRGISRCRIR